MERSHPSKEKRQTQNKVPNPTMDVFHRAGNFFFFPLFSFKFLSKLGTYSSTVGALPAVDGKEQST